jgi:menaquinone-dependent protoporphyrinogen oxidase
MWLFSSGPLGEPLRPVEDPIDVEIVTELTGALGHHLFAGRLERSQLNLLEKAMTAAGHAPEGDFRDWDDVRAWADEIAGFLIKTPEHAGP